MTTFTVGASGALLRIQKALVSRFTTYVSAIDLPGRFAMYNLLVPDPLPSLTMFDEPRAGISNYFRIGDASCSVETGADRLLWSISQDIEAHVDPVRGRALVLVMGEIIELAFEPRHPDIGPPDDPHGGIALRLEPWLTRAELALPDDPVDPRTGTRLAPVQVTDMVQTDSRIGYSEAGLTYQVTTVWDIVAEPL